MKKRILITIFTSGFYLFAFSQPELQETNHPDIIITGYETEVHQPCIEPEEHQYLKNRIAKSVRHMKESGLLQKHFGERSHMAHPLFDWPMRQADGFNDP